MLQEGPVNKVAMVMAMVICELIESARSDRASDMLKEMLMRNLLEPTSLD